LVLTIDHGENKERAHVVGDADGRAGALQDRAENPGAAPEEEAGLVQLGEHTGLSPAMLSKIERGQLFPTLPTLLRIALVFGVGLEHFFVETEERPAVAVIRRNDRLRLPDRPDEEPPSYVFESLDFPVTDRRMESFYAEFPVRSKPSKPHQHGRAEFIYVIEGQLVVERRWPTSSSMKAIRCISTQVRRTAIAVRAGLYVPRIVVVAP
jgi:transcriptional regulator with XRE-family HTH domain